jgi:hypothetical protein
MGGREPNPVQGNGGGRVRKYAESVFGPFYGGKHRQGAGEGFGTRVNGQKALVQTAVPLRIDIGKTPWLIR